MTMCMFGQLVKDFPAVAPSWTIPEFATCQSNAQCQCFAQTYNAAAAVTRRRALPTVNSTLSGFLDMSCARLHWQLQHAGICCAQVANVVSKPENDELSLVEASRCGPSARAARCSLAEL